MSRRLTCVRCPVWKRSIATCLFRGVVMLPNNPVCKYGRIFIKRETDRISVAKRRKEKQ